MRRNILAGILIGVVFIGGVFGLTGIAGCADVSKPADDFTLTDINGIEKKLTDFKGKVVILDFWATWCPPCKMEIPHFVDLYSDYKVKGLEVVGVVLSWQNKQEIEKVIKENNINYTILLGNDEIMSIYDIKAFPTTFVLDKNGTIVKRYIGYRKKEVFEQDIQGLL